MATIKQRKICIYCGCKRVIDKMELTKTKRGCYFQKNKMINGYACTYKKYISDKTCVEMYKEEKQKYD